jgi:beta-lactam-binding protein with PASTA domain
MSLPATTVVPAPAARAAAPTLVTRVLREPVTIIQRVRSHRPVPRARIAAVVLLLAAVVGLTGGVFAVAGGDPAGVKAPDVVGTKLRAARTALTASARDAELPVPKLKVVDRSYSESAPAGAIIAQDPPEGDRITGNGALLVSVSRGSAYADVPSVTGLTGADGYALLERRGFTPSRSYAPSAQIEAWHAIETDPASGARIKRPARVQLVVSTGPPRLPVPALRGLDVNAASEALRDVGFTPAVEQRPSTTSEPGALLSVHPAPGARVPLGSTVTLVVARAPRWEAVTRVEGTEDAEPTASVVPAGGRLVLSTVDTSPLGLWGGSVGVRLSGDGEGETEIDAGETIVLAEASDRERTIEVDIDVDGSAHWALSVQVPR